MDGLPGEEQLVFTLPDVEAVYVWVNLTNVYANDTLTFEYIEPSGAVYHIEEWVAFHWLENTSYTVLSEIEVYASPAEDLPGKWVLEIYNDGILWKRISFEIVSDGSSSGSTNDGSNTIIRGFYIFVKDVKTVGEVVMGQNVTLEMVIEYNFPIESPLVPSIFNEDFEPMVDTSDVIQGAGETTYTLSMGTSVGDDSKMFYAVAYYYVDGNWTFMDPGGYMPFTLSADSSGGSIIPDGFELPDGLDLSNIDMDQIASTLNETFQKGLELLENIEIPDEVSQIEEIIKERTGIPGFPVEAILVGAAAIGIALRKKD